MLSTSGSRLVSLNELKSHANMIPCPFGTAGQRQKHAFTRRHGNIAEIPQIGRHESCRALCIAGPDLFSFLTLFQIIMPCPLCLLGAVVRAPYSLSPILSSFPTLPRPLLWAMVPFFASLYHNVRPSTAFRSQSFHSGVQSKVGHWVSMPRLIFKGASKSGTHRSLLTHFI